VLGNRSSGEVECVVYSFEDGAWVGLGSDHTDRKAEAVGVSLSKQICAKPVSRDIWRLEEVAPHRDALVLRSYVGVNGERRLYQEGSVAAMPPPEELFRLYGQPECLPTAPPCSAARSRPMAASLRPKNLRWNWTTRCWAEKSRTATAFRLSDED